MITVPVKVVFKGDHVACEKLRGQANRIMHVLEKQIKLRGLDQLTMTVETPDGSEITCTKVFDRRTIKITTGAGAGGGKPKKVRCACNCNFSEGYILLVEPDNLDKGDDDVTPLYTIMACVDKGRHYKMFEHVLASDFTKYTKYQKILLVPYYEMSFLCCEGVMTPANGCKPKVSTEALTDQNWRTTYRIIPWCGERVPLWYETRNDDYA
jgi:hypothetical protein